MVLPQSQQDQTLRGPRGTAPPPPGPHISPSLVPQWHWPPAAVFCPEDTLEGTHQGPPPLMGTRRGHTCAVCAAAGMGMVGTAGAVGTRPRLVRGTQAAHPQVQPRCAHTLTCTRKQVAGRERWRAARAPCTLAPHLVQFGLDLDHICLYLVDSCPAVGMGQPGQPAARHPDLTSGCVFASPHTPEGAARLLAAGPRLLTCAPRATGGPRHGS